MTMKIDSELNNPITTYAFELSDEEKIKAIEYHFSKIMETIGLDLSDDSLKDTPGRVAKMYVKELFSGLNPLNKPEVTLFDNIYGYSEMLLEKDITFFSNCEHHFVPIFGRAHVAYISSGKIIGLSKLNRLVNYFSRRPQVQERLTMQIAKDLQEQLETEDVAVLMDARHFCVASRGIKDSTASTVTSFYGGKFKEEALRKEFMNAINLKAHY